MTQHLVKVRTYKELHAFIEKFGEGKLNFVIVIGPGGVGKSEAVKKLCPHVRLLEGRLSAAQFYNICLECRPTTPICLSDIKMVDLKENLEHLRQLTETTILKTMHWSTTWANPQSFITASKLIVLTNDWNSKTPAAKALETRASCIIDFCPSAEELHLQVATGGWFHDQEVFDFMQQHLHLVKEPSFRHYSQAAELRKAELPWESCLLEWILGDEKMQKIATLVLDKSMGENEKARRASQSGLCSERDYFRQKKKLRNMDSNPLTTTFVLPPEPPQPTVEELLAETEPEANESED